MIQMTLETPRLNHMHEDQLDRYLSDQGLFPTTQFAYRRAHSTEDALVLAVDRWKDAQSQRKTVGVVMVDMSKAFDRVQHERLVIDLHSLGFHGKVLEWLFFFFFFFLRETTNLENRILHGRGGCRRNCGGENWSISADLRSRLQRHFRAPKTGEE